MLAGVDPGSVFLGIWDPIEENPKRFPNCLLANCKDVTKGVKRVGWIIRLHMRFDSPWKKQKAVYLTFTAALTQSNSFFINSQTRSTKCGWNAMAPASLSVKINFCIQQEELLKRRAQKRHLKLKYPAFYLHHCEKWNTHCPISPSLWEICTKLIYRRIWLLPANGTTLFGNCVARLSAFTSSLYEQLSLPGNRQVINYFQVLLAKCFQLRMRVKHLASKQLTCYHICFVWGLQERWHVQKDSELNLPLSL